MKLNSRISILIILITFIIPIPLASAASRHVPADHATIQSCIDAAVSGQDECVVAPGTYNELINFLGKAITLRSSHGPAVTTISGTGLNGSVVSCANGEGRDTFLQGFTISGGVGTLIENAPGPYGYTISRVGGGIYNHGTHPVIEDCVLTANQADAGGGIYNDDIASPIVRRCTFFDNHAAVQGGGIYNEDARLTLLDSHFVDNTAVVLGGAVGGHFGFAIVRRCVFERNSSDDSGGAILTDNVAGPIEDCTFEANVASTGGALYTSDYGGGSVRRTLFRRNRAVIGGAVAGSGDVPFESCAFVENLAEPESGNPSDHFRTIGSGGGLAWLGGDPPSFTDCQFIRNRAANGGGAYLGGTSGLFSRCMFLGNVAAGTGGGIQAEPGSPLIVNSLFVGNTAAVGGAAHALWEVHVWNSTIRGNAASSNGGGIAADSVNLVSSILWENTAGGEGAQIQTGNGLYTEIHHCNIQFSGGSANWDAGLGPDGGNNLDDDPLFVADANPGADGTFGTDDDNYGDSRLDLHSPCIHAGDPDFVPQPGENDLDGHARVLCSRVDMGAYEFGIGDYDCDQAVNLTDVAAMQACFTGDSEVAYPAECQSLDFELDGDVDAADWSTFTDFLADP